MTIDAELLYYELKEVIQKHDAIITDYADDTLGAVCRHIADQVEGPPEPPAPVKTPLNVDGDQARLCLQLDVTYNLNGVNGQQLMDALTGLSRHLIDRGGLIEDTPATVETWKSSVIQLPPEFPDISAPLMVSFGDLLADYARAKHGHEEGDLDDAIHGVASHVASNVNNHGMSGQCRYLVEELGVDEARKIIDEGWSR